MTSIQEFYNEQGYYHARGLFSREEMRPLENDFDHIVHQLTASGEGVQVRWTGEAMDKLGAKGTSLVHTHNVQKFSALWLRAFLNPRFLEVAQAILGPDVILHHSKLFQKPAEKGAPFPMHQDWSYFPSVLNTMMAGVIHVSAADDEMGCLRVVPGSHKLGRIEKSDGQTSAKVSDRYPLEEALAVECEPGDVVFFHYYTLHGSKPNRSNKIRKTVLVQMYSGEDQIVEGNLHPNERLVLSGWNSHISRTEAGKLTGPNG